MGTTSGDLQMFDLPECQTLCTNSQSLLAHCVHFLDLGLEETWRSGAPQNLVHKYSQLGHDAREASKPVGQEHAAAVAEAATEAIPLMLAQLQAQQPEGTDAAAASTGHVLVATSPLPSDMQGSNSQERNRTEKGW